MLILADNNGLNDPKQNLSIFTEIVPKQNLKDLVDVGIDPTVVAITALSQGGYLGGKFASRTPLRITRILGGSGR